MSDASFEVYEKRILDLKAKIADLQSGNKLLHNLIANRDAEIERLRSALEAAQRHIGNGYQPPELMDQIERALANKD